MSNYSINLSDTVTGNDIFTNNFIVEDEMNLILSALTAAGFPAQKVYNIKTIDVQRVGLYSVVWREREEIEYVGYGGLQRWIDYDDIVEIYGVLSNVSFQSKIRAFKQQILSYNQSYPVSFIAGKFIYINITNEENKIDTERGIQYYSSRIQTRLYQKTA